MMIVEELKEVTLGTAIIHRQRELNYRLGRGGVRLVIKDEGTEILTKVLIRFKTKEYFQELEQRNVKERFITNVLNGTWIPLGEPKVHRRGVHTRKNGNSIIIIIIIIIVSCHRPFLPGTPLEPAVTPTSHASNVTLQHFPYYV
jgi:hypothetical protein